MNCSNSSPAQPNSKNSLAIGSLDFPPENLHPSITEYPSILTLLPLFDSSKYLTLNPQLPSSADARPFSFCPCPTSAPSFSSLPRSSRADDIDLCARPRLTSLPLIDSLKVGQGGQSPQPSSNKTTLKNTHHSLVNE